MSAVDAWLDLAAVGVLGVGVAALWRREVSALVGLLRLQGLALAAVAGLTALAQRDGVLGATALVVLVVKVLIVPSLLHRSLGHGEAQRESEPLVNVPSSLVVAGVLVGLAILSGTALGQLSARASVSLAPLGLATVLVGYFLLVTRRRAVSQIVGLLIVDNGVALTAFLLTAGVPLIIELGGSLDVMLVVVVAYAVLARLRHVVGDVELDRLRELRD